MKINVLGTEYEIVKTDKTNEKRLEHNWGFVDYNTKQIYIDTDLLVETDESCKNLKYFENKVLRHEIIHAFLYESGLRENSFDVSGWAENEEMVDWFAIQSPKIFEIYKKLDILC